MTSKIRTIPFNRNPRFTPDLSVDLLDAIERAAYQTVEAMQTLGHEAQKFDDLNLGEYLNPDFCARFGIEVPAFVFADDSAWNYLRTSINFLIVCAGKRGWLKPYSQIESRRAWAEIRGGY